MTEIKIVTVKQLDVDVKILVDGKKVRFWLNSNPSNVPSFSTPLKKRRDGKLFYCYFYCDKGIEVRVYQDGKVVST